MMNDPFEALNWMHPLRSGDSFDPTAEELDRRLSGAGTYLLVISKTDIEALQSGRMIGFYLDDMQNILIRWDATP